MSRQSKLECSLHREVGLLSLLDKAKKLAVNEYKNVFNNDYFVERFFTRLVLFQKL